MISGHWIGEKTDLQTIIANIINFHSLLPMNLLEIFTYKSTNIVNFCSLLLMWVC